MRLFPHWEFRSFGHEIPNPFFPGILLPGLVFTVMFAWPWIDRRVYNDYGEHNLLDRPRDKPLRTAVGVAAIIFFADLTMACATDIMGNKLQISFERLIEILQYGSFIGPIAGGLVAYRACLLLQAGGVHPIQRPVGGTIVRDERGAYHTLGASHGENGHDADGHHGSGQDGAEHSGAEVLERVGAGPEAQAEDRPRRAGGGLGPLRTRSGRALRRRAEGAARRAARMARPQAEPADRPWWIRRTKQALPDCPVDVGVRGPSGLGPGSV